MLASCNPSQTRGESQIILWNVSSGERIDTNFSFSSSALSIASSVNKNIFATGHSNSEIIIWKIKETKSIQNIEYIASLKVHKKSITSICFHPTHEFILASASDDNTVGIWNIETGDYKIFSEHSDRVLSVSFNIDGSILASCSDDKTIKLWNPKTGECRQTITVDPPYKGMNITGTEFSTPSERKTLLALGAVDDSEFNI
jgi:WD40 repeat protein